MLNLDAVEVADERQAESLLRLARAVRQVGMAIIEFLAQFEDGQKVLREKNKFLVEAFYAVAVGAINEAFYAEIAAKDKQLAKWEMLLGLSALSDGQVDGDMTIVEGRVGLLKAHPTLPLDTRHFSSEFADLCWLRLAISTR